MPHTGTTSPSMRRTEHSDSENSDVEDAVTLNAQTGMKDYSETKNDSDHSLNDGRSSSSDGNSSFVGKIRSNFSGMLSVLLPPVRQRKQSGRLTQDQQPSEPHSNPNNNLDEQNEERVSIDLRKRPHSPNSADTDVVISDNRTYEMIRKRPRLRETWNANEEERSRPSSATLRTRTSNASNTSQRLRGLMSSNSAYIRRMQQSRSGYAHNTLFGSSHLKSTKDRNDSVASSRRPSFNISVAKMSKSMSNGWIPPEYGGSPFYEGFTRFGGASSARTLATQGPSRPAVTVLVKKSHPVGKAQSLPDAQKEAKPETYASAMSFPARRILELVDEYAAKSSSSKREKIASYPDIRKPRTLQMLNLIRSQQTERSENTTQPSEPPTASLMEYTLPSHVDSPTNPTRQEEPKSTGGKQMTKKTRLHADPIKERDVDTVEPIQLPNLKLPLLIEGLPKFDFIVPMKGPLLSADKEEGLKNTKGINGNKLLANDENKQRGELERNTPTPTTFSEIRSFGFTSPIPLNSLLQVTDVVSAVPDSSAQETSISLFREMTTFVFESPTLLNDSSQITNAGPTKYNEFPSLPREKPTFVFASTIVLGNSSGPVPAATMSFKFAAPKQLEVLDAPKVRSFQDLMAESAAKWSCDVCMIRNEPHQQKCIACESPKPLKVPDAPKVRSFQDLMAESAAKWACDVCMIRNEPHQQKCIACETPKPVKVPDAPKVRSFQDLVAESATKWSCDVCMIRNEPHQQKCIACESPKPLEVPDAPKVRSFQDLMAESATKWACDVCMIRNEPNQQKCIACESPKPATQPVKNKEAFLPAGTSITNTATSGSFAAIVNTQSSRWECEACSVRNDPTATVCVCCATEKPCGKTV
ncbi:nuclear pore complex protein Nup153 [Anopheles moucheti]|uniref:nuclear pore complex protein Nup153 n=1 Tax=Anopheles moucheti TaxID=186751 RepID=UPI0022F091C0|nr:nuclear pore complex protein Nup153 [Anopheles moucheti]XP_052902756.1 nuclear pore complex protein Nup153 [Anopheles moucheti]